MFVARTVVEVAVSIDKSGKVTKAEATPQKNVSQFLINSAVTAARRWKFRPAQRGDEPVSSEMVLQFIFDH
jgi:TonB family protein